MDWFTLMVEGVPKEWVRVPDEEVQLNPNMQETADLYINVARVPQNVAQEYPVIIRARSRENPQESGSTKMSWTVQPFKEDSLRLEPRRATGRGKAAYALTLRNGGNILERYELRGDDDEQKMHYIFEEQTVPLEPGREKRVRLRVETKKRFIGSEERSPFQIHARALSNEAMQVSPGEFVNKALLPTWTVAAFCALLLIGGSILAYASGFIPQAGAKSPDFSATITALAQNGSSSGATQIAQVQASATAATNATAASTSQGVHGTATAQANATGTAQGNTNATATAQATGTALQNPSPYGGTLTFQDALANNSNNWCVYSAQCNFSGGVLHEIDDGATGPSYVTSVPQNANLNVSNFAYQVQMKVLKGFGGGILFRADSSVLNYYYFLVGADGTYQLIVRNDTASPPSQTIKSGSSPLILTGLNQTNSVAIVAQGNLLQMYVNQQFVTSVNDNTYVQGGTIGVLAYDSGHPNNPTDPPVEVVFNDAKVWTL